VSAATGVVFWDDVDELEVKEAIVIEEIQPLRIDEGLELLEAPVSFLRSNQRAMQGPDGTESGFRGNICTDRWPPRVRMGVYDSRNLALNAGDFIVPAFVTRARRVGDWSATGLRIIYRQGGRRFQQITGTFDLMVSIRSSDAELSGLEGRCNPNVPHGFLWGPRPPEGKSTTDNDGERRP